MAGGIARRICGVFSSVETSRNVDIQMGGYKHPCISCIDDNAAQASFRHTHWSAYALVYVHESTIMKSSPLRGDPNTAWQIHFTAHVTKVAFSLQLSRRMVQVLHIARDCDNQLALPMLVHGTCLNLVRRGLIEFKMTESVHTSRYALTDAGIK